MTSVAIILVSVSALIHGGWNLLGKRSRPDPAYFALATAVGCLVLSPGLIIWSHVLLSMPSRSLLLVVCAGFFQSLYFTGLAGAYRHGDLSVAYPVARAIPVLLVPLVTGIVGLGEPIGILAVVGMIAVALGMLVLPQTRFSQAGFSLRDRWFLYAVLAALGTSGYSTIDDRALDLFRAAVPDQRVPVTLVYAFWESLFTVLWLVVVGTLTRGGAQLLSDIGAVPKRSAIFAGLGIILAYSIVLVAMGFASNVGYIVAFRQLSIPVGAILGVVALGEGLPAPKILGLALMTAGLVLVAIG